VHVGDAAVGDEDLGAVEQPGSVTPNAPSAIEPSSFSNIFGAHLPNCSGVPEPARPASARPVPKIARVIPAQPQVISSDTIAEVSPVSSAPAIW
jgi:hypothetical protein